MVEVLIILLLFSLVFIAILFRKYHELISDVSLFSVTTSNILRTGKVKPGILFNNSTIEISWRKILAFYAGVSRMAKVKGDSDLVLTNAIDLLNMTEDSSHIFQILSEVLLRSSAPESKFVAIAEYSNTRHAWSVKAASGMSNSRLEDPLLLAIEALPFSAARDMIYTSPQNGPLFDFRGLGVGLSLFAAVRIDNQVRGVVWIGFGENIGIVDERRRETLELTIKHAIVSYIAAQKSDERHAKIQNQKDRMLALSHDLKSPSVRALYAMKELRESFGNLSNNANYLLGEIEFAIEEQLGLISELFASDKKSSVSDVSEVEIDGCISQRLESFFVIAKSVDIELKYEKFIRAKIRMPKEVLNRILDNLLSNAIKYTRIGHVEVSSQVVGAKVVVTIQDTGIGVKSELIPFLFSAKMREQDKVENSGQGYGLCVVRKLLEDWGGSITYEKKESGGSKFIFELPFVSLIDSPAKSASDLYTVLIVDDDEVVLNAHSKWLKNIVQNILLCKSFEEARALLKLNKPDLIISDVNIVGEDFYDFMTRLDTSHKVVALSAESKFNLEQRCKGFHNIIAFYEKPIDRISLCKVVQNLLYQKKVDKEYEKAA